MNVYVPAGARVVDQNGLCFRVEGEQVKAAFAGKKCRVIIRANIS